MLRMPQEPLQTGTLILTSCWLPLQPSAHLVLGNSGKAFYEPSAMTHKAKESPNLCVSLWQCIFNNGFYIGVTRPNTSL